MKLWHFIIVLGFLMRCFFAELLTGNDIWTSKQSSKYWFSGPSQALDGRSEYCYYNSTNLLCTGCAKTYPTGLRPPWWRAYFKSNCFIQSVSLLNRAHCCADRMGDIVVSTYSHPYYTEPLENETICAEYTDTSVGLNETLELVCNCPSPGCPGNVLEVKRLSHPNLPNAEAVLNLCEVKIYEVCEEIDSTISVFPEMTTEEYSTITTEEYSTMTTEEYSTITTEEYSTMTTSATTSLPSMTTEEYSTMTTEEYSTITTSATTSLPSMTTEEYSTITTSVTTSLPSMKTCIPSTSLMQITSTLQSTMPIETTSTIQSTTPMETTSTIQSTTLMQTTSTMQSTTSVPITTSSPTAAATATITPTAAKESTREPKCYCPCNTIKPKNKTTQAAIFEELVKELTIDVKKTKTSLRKLSSSEDKRTSATVVGTVGLIFIITLMVLLVTSDVITLMAICRQN